jgi:hypothetical protein
MPAGAPLGNKNGSKGKMFLNTLRLIIAQEETTLPEGRRRLRLAADRLIALAAEGEEWAIKELANRLDGKAVQGVELSGSEGAVNFFNPATLRNLSPDETNQLQILLKKAASE